MNRLLSLALLLLALGCADKTTKLPAAREASYENATTADAPVELIVPQNDRPLAYPEKANVERLLVRASELESNGKFQDAFVVANQAVAMDPSSPRANEMKARLEELLRRLQAAPGTDERTGPSQLAQRTTD